MDIYILLPLELLIEKQSFFGDKQKAIIIDNSFIINIDNKLDWLLAESFLNEKNYKILVTESKNLSEETINRIKRLGKVDFLEINQLKLKKLYIIII